MINEPEDDFEEEFVEHLPVALTPEQFAQQEAQRYIERQQETQRVISLQSLSFALQSSMPGTPTQEIVDRAEAFRTFLSAPSRRN